MVLGPPRPVAKEDCRAGCFLLCLSALSGLNPEQGVLQMSIGPWGWSTKHSPASPPQWDRHEQVALRVGYSLEIPQGSSRWTLLGLLGVGTPTGAFASCEDQCSGAVPAASSNPTCHTEASYSMQLAERTTRNLSLYVLAAK